MQQNSLRNIPQTIYRHLLNTKAAQTQQLCFLIHLNTRKLQWGEISLLLVIRGILCPHAIGRIIRNFDLSENTANILNFIRADLHHVDESLGQ